MNEERLFTVSRWLLALTLIFIPLSIVVLISVVFAYNYPDRQWTRYLLLLSWISSALSFLLGLMNLIGFSMARGGENTCEERETEGEDQGEEDFMSSPPSTMAVESLSHPRGGGHPAGGMLMGQAFTLAVSVILYVAFLCWMLLPGIRVQM